MRRYSRYLLVVPLLIAALVTVQPAFANHKYTIQSVTCNPVTNTITVKGFNQDVQFFNRVFVNGSFLFDSTGTLSPGAVQNTYTNAAFKTGAVILVTNPPNSPTGTGGNGSSASTICGSSTVYQGPPIPAGFVLQMITCNTTVYSTVDGTAITIGGTVFAGQTWYVNPKVVIGLNGRSWTEIFVSGIPNSFIPTSCIYGAMSASQIGGGALPKTGSSPSSSSSVSVPTGGSSVRVIIVTPYNAASAQAQINSLISQGFSVTNTQQIGVNTYVTLKR